MTTDGGGWMLGAVIDSGSNNFGGSSPILQHNSGILGEVGYSVDLDTFDNSSDGFFDVMIQYGDEDVYSDFHERFTKNGASFFTEPTGVEEGEHGLVGTGSEYGIFNTYCANAGTCLEYTIL
jgi:hypothetical protein